MWPILQLLGSYAALIDLSYVPHVCTNTLSYMTISERQDNEIAKEIQEQLVRQAEQQRQQEEKDAVRHTEAHKHTHTWLFPAQCWLVIHDLTCSIIVSLHHLT